MGNQNITDEENFPTLFQQHECKKTIDPSKRHEHSIPWASQNKAMCSKFSSPRQDSLFLDDIVSEGLFNIIKIYAPRPGLLPLLLLP